MRFLPLVLLVVAALAALPARAQAPAAPADAPAQWRDVSGYRFPARAQLVADMQNLAHAMQLRDYCADRRVPDDFVRERLARFSRITGREESCATLRDY